MRYRLREGNGEAYYMIGVEDNGKLYIYYYFIIIIIINIIIKYFKGNPEGLTKA